ncbi:MAG: hypothetical protein IPG50_30815 [Myxococcales bacterium]|nr:hypothetical protein [Myxococcales bacterium]
MATPGGGGSDANGGADTGAGGDTGTTDAGTTDAPTDALPMRRRAVASRSAPVSVFAVPVGLQERRLNMSSSRRPLAV